MRGIRAFTTVFLTTIILIAVWRCSSSTKGETTQDSMATAVTDSVATESPAQPVAIVDTRTLKERLDERFASNLPSGLDSAQYIKLVVRTSYNEYEGQTQSFHSEWYFDKTFSPRFFRELHRYGDVLYAGEGGWYFNRAFTPEYYGLAKNRSSFESDPYLPEIKEYWISKDSIISSREDRTYFKGNASGRSITNWSVDSGGIKSSWTYDSSTLVNDSVAAQYRTDIRKDWLANVAELKRVLKKGYVSDEDENIVVVQLVEPKESSDLMDSTEVIIPRAIYKRYHKSRE